MSDESEGIDRRISGFSLVGKLLGSDSLSFWEIMAVAAFAIGTLTIMSFAFPLDVGWWLRSSTMFSIAIGAWMGGGALGFLFGVPRYKSAPEHETTNTSSPVRDVMAFTPNTNLEQISDWLTKIIVGATLVQLGQIKVMFIQLCGWTASQIHKPEAGIFCGGIMVFFFFSGFLWGYLWCSIRIFREMVRLTTQLR